jgi:predicted HicB family RNase H-like nuclease
MEYKGYRANVRFSDEDDAFLGKVVGIRAQIVFHGTSVRELRRNFRAVVDNYLAHCAKDGDTPVRPTRSSSAATSRKSRGQKAVAR